MGTHPIFESNFDCLTENKMDAQKKRKNNDAVRKSRERKKNKIEERKKAKNDLEARINELTNRIEEEKNNSVEYEGLLKKNWEELTESEKTRVREIVSQT